MGPDARKGSTSAPKGSSSQRGAVLPMCDRRLRAKMMDMTPLLSQPFVTAQSDAVVGAGVLPRRRAGRWRVAARSRRPLRIGIQLPEVERQVRWTEVLAIARTAEACGFA